MTATMRRRDATVLINRVSRLMGDRRLTIEEVAQGSGLSRRTVHDLYHDKSNRFDRDTLNRLCAFFDVPPDQVLEWHRADEDPPVYTPTPGAPGRRRRPPVPAARTERQDAPEA